MPKQGKREERGRVSRVGTRTREQIEVSRKALQVAVGQYSQRCACRRIYAQLDQWSYNRQLEPPPDESFSESEMRQFKEACYLMLLAPEKWTRTRALEHLVFLADTRDAARLKALLRRPEAELDHGLICLALGRIGGEDAIPLLVKELDGRRWEEAYTAIQRIGGPKAEAALTGRKKPPDAD
jgi:hypothetical protein